MQFRLACLLEHENVSLSTRYRVLLLLIQLVARSFTFPSTSVNVSTEKEGAASAAASSIATGFAALPSIVRLDVQSVKKMLAQFKSDAAQVHFALIAFEFINHLPSF